ncbi:MAG: calcium-binding protein, partial [Alphaproteobacteria bacterium]
MVDRVDNIHGDSGYVGVTDQGDGAAPETSAVTDNPGDFGPGDSGPGDIGADAGSSAQMAMDETVVQVAAANPTIENIPTPSTGGKTVIQVHPGVHYAFDFPLSQAELVLSEGDLHILIKGGGEIVLKGYSEAVAAGEIPPIDFAGQTIAALDLLSQVATAEQLAEIAPAAGPGAGGGPGNTGAAFSPYQPGPLPPGIAGDVPLPPTALGFGAPEVLPFVLPARLEELLAAPPVIEECFNFGLPQLESFFASMSALSIDKPEEAPQPANHPGSFFDGVTIDLGGGNDPFSGGDLNDSIVGGAGNDALYGYGGQDWIEGGTGNDIVVGGEGNDSLFGGDGNDTMAGDVGGSYATISSVARTGQSVANYNDYLSGGNGDDLLAGDVVATSEAWMRAGAFGSGASVNAFNDYLSGGDGNDTMAGDVLQYGYGASATLLAAAEGFDNVVNAYNDTLFGGAGNDIVVGDVGASMNGGSAEITLGAYGYGVGNTANAFNDVIVGGTGDDSLVGDVAIVGRASGYDVSVYMNASAFGSDNTVNAFNDQLFADSNDLLVGDVAVSVGGYAYNEITMWAYGWGYGNGVDAYNDYLQGGVGFDTLVGDVLQFGGEGFVRTYGFAIGYGIGNDIYAFNDKLVGGAEGFAGGFSGRVCDVQFSGSVSGALHEATLVGDVLQSGRDGAAVFLIAGGEGESNSVTAFNDHLEGGKVLVGDVLQDGSYSNYDLVALRAGVAAAYGFGGEGFHQGSNSVFAFNDHLIGGDDSITGSLTVHGPQSLLSQPTDGQGFAGGEGAVLVGDVMQYGHGGQYGSFDRVDLWAGQYGFGYGNGDQVVAFNDSIDGGNNSLDVTVNVMASATGSVCFDELLSGGVGIFSDLMVGDVYRTGRGEVSMVAYGYGQESVAAFNDTMTGGSDHIGIDITFEDTAKSAEINTNELAILLGGMGDVLVGDVYQVIPCGAEGNVNLYGVAINFTPGEDSVYAFNDEIIGGNHEIDITGDATVIEGKPCGEIPGDVLVGDVLAQGNDQFVALQAYGYGIFTHLCVFNDTITAGQDIVMVNGEAVPVTGIQDTLVGDVWMEVGKGEQGGELQLSAWVYGFGNHMEAYSDVITDGNGDNILVGDAWYDIGKCASGPSQSICTTGSANASVGAIDMFAGAFSPFFGGAEGFAGNEVRAFNDTLVSGDGDNTMVGDAWHEVGKFGVGESAHLDVWGYAYSSHYYYDYYQDYANARAYGFGAAMAASISSSGDAVSAFNDELTAGIGSNVLVGDAWFDVSKGALGQNVEINENVCKNWGEISLNGGIYTYYSDNYVQNNAFAVAHVYGLGLSAAAQGFDNDLSAYNDQLTVIPGGEGFINDTLVGDAWYHVDSKGEGANVSISQKVDLSAYVYVAGGEYGYVNDAAQAFATATGIWMSAWGGEGNSTVSAYNDTLSAGDGQHVLVGDAWFQVEDCADGQHIGINQHVQLAGSISSDGIASANVYAVAYGYGFGIAVSAGAGGEGSGDTGDNVSAYNDELTAGNGAHALVGDNWYDVGNWATGQSICVNQCVAITSSDVTYDLNSLYAYANAYVVGSGVWMSAWASGTGNTVSAYNDMLTAGSGESVLVGDAWYSVGYG